nr:hypothetical protein OG781_15410 [Streptomyces sp. NBC_00830]
MAAWTVKAEPVTGQGVEAAMCQYFTEIGLRVLGRAATESELREVLDEDPHHDLSPPHGVFLVARGALSSS